MIDFQNAKYLKLKPVEDKSVIKLIAPILIDGEVIVSAFKSVRDSVIFTNKRIIAINIQGMTGTKKDFTSLPYKRISAYCIETAGVFDMDSELELYFSGLGKVRFEFVARANVSEICKIISSHLL